MRLEHLLYMKCIKQFQSCFKSNDHIIMKFLIMKKCTVKIVHNIENKNNKKSNGFVQGKKFDIII